MPHDRRTKTLDSQPCEKDSRPLFPKRGRESLFRPQKMGKVARRICFVTGTRAEFGLMESTLRAIVEHPKLTLNIVATGMHLDRQRGNSKQVIDQIGLK